MPLFKISLRQAADLGFARPRKWSTTFYADRVDANSAALFGVDLWGSYLRNASRASVFCYESYATSVNEVDQTFATLPIATGNQRGTIAVPAGEPMPLEHNLAVPLLVANSRPDRKFWRVPIYQAEFVDGAYIGTVLSGIVQNVFENAIDNAVDLRSSDGEAFAAVGEPKASLRRLGRTAGFDVPLGPPVE